MPYTDYTVRLGDLKRAIVKNPYDPNLNIDGYMRYLKYNTPSAQQEPNYCRECKWSRCHIYAGKHGESETYWRCLNWDGEGDGRGVWSGMKNHCQKQRDIERIRRELMELHKMLNPWRKEERK